VPLSAKAMEWITKHQTLINSVAAGEAVFTYRKLPNFLKDTKSKNEQKAQLKKWLGDGKSPQAIAENLGISRQAVYARLIKFGLKKKTRRLGAKEGRVVHNTDGKLRNLREYLKDAGYTAVAACRRLGLENENLLNQCISSNKKLTEAEYNALLNLLNEKEA